jgi:HSP20 family molecular chaperone IbpA
MSNNQNAGKRSNNGGNNSTSVVPTQRGQGRPQQHLAQRTPTYLANNLDQIFEDFRSSFNQLMTPFMNSPWYPDTFLAPLALLPELTESSSHVHQARYPVIDVLDEGDYFSVSVELPGFNKDNVDIQVGEDGTLQLTAQVSTEHKSGRYMSHERSYSAFQRAIQLPEQVVPGKVEGKMEDGILSLRIPKREPVSTKFTRVALK